MWVAAEEYLLINFVMDFLFLYLASRGTWFLRAARLISAALFASAYALLDAIWGCGTGWDAAAFACACAIAFPVREGRLFVKAAFLSVTGILIFGSTVRFFLSRGGGTLFSGFLGAISGAVCISLAKMAFRTCGNRQTAHFRVKYGGVTAEFSAIIDTGNLLKEPISALPVLIADEKALGKRFLISARASKHLREAAYASVGGDGFMACLRTASMEVNWTGRWVKAPDMYLGLYPGVMQGGVHALAPPAVNEALGIRRK